MYRMKRTCANIKKEFDYLFFQEHEQNSSRFPGFPGDFRNSSRFSGFPGVVDTLSYDEGIVDQRFDI